MNIMAQNTERLKKSGSEKPSKKLGKSPEKKEFKEAVQAREAVESVGVAEGAETIGHVAESASEDKSKDMGAGAQAVTTSDDNTPAAIKERLLENLPAIEVMKSQIEKEINKEINYLHNKAMRMARTPGDVNYYEYNNLLKKIRELKRILGKMIKAPLEALKTLWLRYVHGIM